MMHRGLIWIGGFALAWLLFYTTYWIGYRAGRSDERQVWRSAREDKE